MGDESKLESNLSIHLLELIQEKLFHGLMFDIFNNEINKKMMADNKTNFQIKVNKKKLKNAQ